MIPSRTSGTLRPPRRPGLLAALLLAALALPWPGLLWPGAELAAQTRFVVVEEPEGTAVGVAVIINAGSAWEMRSEAGLTYLAARSVLEGLRAELDALGGRTAVECDPVGMRFTLSVPAATWESAAEYYLGAIFDARIEADAVERARRAILAEAALAEESLSTAIRTALAQAEFGESDRWGRPGCGNSASIAALSAEEARRLAETRFTPYRATAAVAGPVDQVAARALLSRYLPDSELPVLVAAPAGAPSGQTRTIEQNAVTAWVGIAFSFPRAADLEALRLLAYQITREVTPAPTRPEIYDATVEISQHGGGGTLVVYLVTAPTHAREWIDRVRRIARHAAEAELPEPAFDALHRRFTGARLLELDSPENRARDSALQLFFEHAYTPPAQRIAALTPAALRDAAALLGEPAVALLGPR
jgi:predicted Zn-dependent peptidase